VIGGRVLDTTALLDAGTGRTVYFRALVIAATRLGTTLVVPTTAWAEAWALAPEPARGFLDLMAEHPLVVFDPVDVVRGREAGLLAAGVESRGMPWSVRSAHVARVSLERDFPVVTADPEPLLSVDAAVRIEQLP
jgi:hypothetical protein